MLKTKLTGLAVAFTLVFSGVVSASALSTSELIDLLVSMGIISSDQVGVVNAAVGGSSSSDSCALTMAPDMTLGATGANVTELQMFLQDGGYLSMPAGVAYGYFGGLTQSALASYQAAMGITPASGYFGPITRSSISCAPVADEDEDEDEDEDDSGLNGGAGDITFEQKTSGTETTVSEGGEEVVLRLEAEADDNSDIEVTSFRLIVTPGNDGSTRLNRYLDEIVIELEGEEVGSVDASDFSRNGAVHTATVSLRNAVVEADEKADFDFRFITRDLIDSDDLDNTVNVEVDRVRYEDATGAILSESGMGHDVDVTFEDSSSDDDARIRSNSSSPDASLLKVYDNKSSDDHEILVFDIDVDDDSSDLVVLEIDVELEINNASGTAIDAESLIKNIYIEIDGEEYDDYEFDITSLPSGVSTTTVTFTIDEGDLEISEGDRVEAVVFVEFDEVDGNYVEGTTIEATVRGADMVAENPEGDQFDVDGSTTGNVHTLQIAAAEIEGFDWKVNNTGTILDFFFTVTAVDEDFTVLAADIASSTDGTATTSAGVLSVSTGDADPVSGGYKVLDGDTATFRVRYSVSGANGTWSEVTITSVAGQELPTSDQVSDTATVNVNR